MDEASLDWWDYLIECAVCGFFTEGVCSEGAKKEYEGVVELCPNCLKPVFLVWELYA